VVSINQLNRSVEHILFIDGVLSGMYHLLAVNGDEEEMWGKRQQS